MIKFGVAGNSDSFYAEGNTATIQAAAWCKGRGIDIFEYSFGKGINISDKSAADIGYEFNKNGIEMSVHAPYYINFANTDPLMIAKSINYVINSAKKLQAFGLGDRVVFHPAAQGKLTREDAVKLTSENIKLLVDAMEESGYSEFKICAETMGKHSQIGTLEEVVSFCSLSDMIYPCIDFGHLNARTGGALKTADDYRTVIRLMLDNLPFNKVRDMHVHFSKIMYGEKGEIKHLTFSDDLYGPPFSPLAEVLHEYNLEPKIICESDGTQAEDAAEMKNIFNSLSK